MPTLSVCIVTQDLAPLLPGLLSNVEDLADEIVIVDGGSRDETPGIAAAHPKVRLVTRPFDDAAGQKNHAIEQARCEWVLLLDTDERLGERLRGKLPALLKSSRRNWYKFPRYWIVGGHPLWYVKSEQHYPDWQLRLFRNLPVFRYTPDRPIHHHFPRRGRGPGRRIRGAHIFHFDFLLNDRARREAKVARYEAISPESASTHSMYLYEDRPHVVRRCREACEGAGEFCG